MDLGLVEVELTLTVRMLHLEEDVRLHLKGVMGGMVKLLGLALLAVAAVAEKDGTERVVTPMAKEVLVEGVDLLIPTLQMVTHQLKRVLQTLGQVEVVELEVQEILEQMELRVE